jgi:hypothetical protein
MGLTVLQPVVHITYSTAFDKALIQSFQEVASRIPYLGLKANNIGHGVDTGNWFLQASMDNP